MSKIEKEFTGSDSDIKLEYKLGLLESILFASEEPINEKVIAEAAEQIIEAEIEDLAEKLDDKYRRNNHGIMVQRVAGGWRLTTQSKYAEAVKKLLRGRIRTKLSRASLETVSIIAYKQPITRAEIESIRGVDPAPVLRNLLERELIKITGRAEAPGRPLVYGTSAVFLTYFGLDDIASLPKPEEILGDLPDSGNEVQNSNVEEELNSK
ncbi:SMC-Scp complex subunit ScpB [Calditrichota bacterium]